MMQQRARSWAASSSFYIGASSGESAATDSSCLRARRCQLHRLALLLLSLLLLCGAAAGCTFLMRSVGAWPDRLASSTRRQAASTQPLPSYADSDSDDGSGRAVYDDGRTYLTSNLSLLQTGGWSPSFRFHPASFHPAAEVLNHTVHCDRPSTRDLRLVYSDPTWLCKNIRVGDNSRLPFSDATSSPLEELLINRHEEMHGSWPSVGDSCGRLPDRRDNVLLLCELMLARLARLGGGPSLQTSFRASSVHIPYGNCSLPERKRVILVGMTTTDAVWYTEKLWKPGFVTDIYCSFSA